MSSPNVNQAEGDQDPAEWLPPLAEVHCRYLTEWVVVKYRWHPSIDPAEHAALYRLAVACPDADISVEPAA